MPQKSQAKAKVILFTQLKAILFYPTETEAARLTRKDRHQQLPNNDHDHNDHDHNDYDHKKRFATHSKAPSASWDSKKTVEKFLWSLVHNFFLTTSEYVKNVYAKEEKKMLEAEKKICYEHVNGGEQTCWSEREMNEFLEIRKPDDEAMESRGSWITRLTKPFPAKLQETQHLGRTSKSSRKSCKPLQATPIEQNGIMLTRRKLFEFYSAHGNKRPNPKVKHEFMMEAPCYPLEPSPADTA